MKGEDTAVHNVSCMTFKNICDMTKSLRSLTARNKEKILPCSGECRLQVEIGDCKWKVEIAVESGDYRWRVEIASGEWRLQVESGDSKWRVEIVS